jgi:hypothetical protein
METEKEDEPPLTKSAKAKKEPQAADKKPAN